MTFFFEIKPSFDAMKEQYRHPTLDAEGSAWELGRWRQALDESKNTAERNALPGFTPCWWIKHQPESVNFPDWPFNIYRRAVCSKKMWNVMQPFCEAVDWVPLPATVDGACIGWGVIHPVPLIELCEKKENLPHFFEVRRPQSADKMFCVSQELKKALENAELIGVEFGAVKT